MSNPEPGGPLYQQKISLQHLRQAILQAQNLEAVQKIRRENAFLINHIASNLLSQHAPLQSAHQRFSDKQKFQFACFLLAAATGFILVPVMTAVVFLFALQFFFIAVLVFRLWLVQKSLQPNNIFEKPCPLIRHDRNLPVITILIPLYKEQAAIPHLVKAMNRLDYPAAKLDIKILLEQDDETTIAAARHAFRDAYYDLILVPPFGPRTKPKACNHGLWTARGTYVVIYDAEDRPEPDQLKKAIAAFARDGPRLACVQARLNYFNRNRNWLTRLFAIEYALLFDFILPGLTTINAPIPLGGTSNFFRTDALLSLGGWDAYNVTEDADLGMRLARAGLQTAMIDSTTWEEAVCAARPWLRQRSRWTKGYIQTWLVHMRAGFDPLRQQSWLFAASLHLLVAGVAITGLVNPIFWAVFAASLAGLIDVSPLFPPSIAVLAGFSFLVGNFFHLYLYLAAPMRRRWYGLLGFGLLAPIYWIMQSVGAWMALWQFITKPFYWEKTNHFERPDKIPPAANAKAKPQAARVP